MVRVMVEMLENKDVGNIRNMSIENPFSDAQEEHKWYVVGVSKNREAALQRTLLSMIGIPPFGVQTVYLPTEVVRKWKNNKQIDEEKPIMSYLFVLSKPGYLENRETRLLIKVKYSVIGTISEDEIKRMEREFSNTAPVMDFDLKVGSKVTVIKGSFIGLNGQVQSIGQDGFITVRIWLMQGCEPTDIEVQISDVGPIDNR